MKKGIEDFIARNREAFDDKEPSANVWKKIQNDLAFSKPSLWNSLNMWRAAAVIFMAMSVYLFISKLPSQKQQEIAMKEFTDVERFYVDQISEKTELIQEFKKNDGMNGFTHDFQQLEAMYMVLKEEMKNRPSQKVKDALVLNLLVRIDLLNQQLHKLENNEYNSEGEESREEKRPSKNA